jgi:mannose-6-phosphate isomerase-like protein (cupin superfamily)
MVVAQTDDAVLVCPKERSQDVKKIVELLKDRKNPVIDYHPTVRRPWGTFTVLEEGPCFKIKKITVDPGQRLSLQRHRHRAEHWVVVEGTAQVTCGGKQYTLTANESTYISPGLKHRLENPGTSPLSIIEVQTGSYVGEDDIERFEDVYGRK